ncbi:RSP_7527 family protein [Pseudoroseicyclus sp. CXY001]
MTNDIQHLSLSEIEARAHRMRAEALREMVRSFVGRRARRSVARAA